MESSRDVIRYEKEDLMLNKTMIVAQALHFRTRYVPPGQLGAVFRPYSAPGSSAGEQEDFRAIFAGAAQATTSGMRQQQGPEKMRGRPDDSLDAQTSRHQRVFGIV